MCEAGRSRGDTGRASGFASPIRCAAIAALALLAGTPAAALDLESNGLQPTYLGTGGLEELLDTLSTASAPDDWPRLDDAPTLRPGDRSPAVVRLRERLAATADGLAPSPPDPELYDAALESAVREFQRDHALAVDGIVGPRTRAELDRSPFDRRRQIARTIAARRALPRDLGRRFLIVNLPAFELEAFEDGRPALRSRVVVGAPYRPTPQLASSVRTVVVHPDWDVPPRIARQEIAARAEREPDYVARLGFEVFVAGTPGRRLDPFAVDWSAFRAGEVDLVLRQRPGPYNALGQVSVHFANPYNIALHDTPEQEAFERARRAESHGCVRVEGALELARWLIDGDTEEARRRFERSLGGGVTTPVALAEPVPIYVVDWPVWIDAGGDLQARAELYTD